MLQTGQEVVCINDTYDEWVIALYDELPIKGYTYTVQDVSFGRNDIKDRTINGMVECITLKELKNKNDPHYTAGKKELSFMASRFKPLEEAFDEYVLKNKKEETTLCTL